MAEYDIKNNVKIAKTFKNILELDSEPVAVKFVLKESDIPENIPKISDKARHCEMVKKASHGETFYATKDEQMCKGGSAALGLEDMPPKVASGEKYVSLGRFKDIKSAKATIDALPKMDVRNYGILYAPLETATYAPDVVVMFAKPVQAMKVSQAIIYDVSDRFKADFAGIQSLCADAVSEPAMTGNANITLGCSGSRKFAKVLDDEVAVGLSAENVLEVSEALEALN
ncbi:MAG: DUF169 domain-containing protein [Methanobacteriaceae archaeon]|nr:DUF169 domain-containing protein [Methanobacteriaceae archaeon]